MRTGLKPRWRRLTPGKSLTTAPKRTRLRAPTSPNISTAKLIPQGLPLGVFGAALTFKLRATSQHHGTNNWIQAKAVRKHPIGGLPEDLPPVWIAIVQELLDHRK